MEPGLPAPRQHIASKVFADSTPACKNLFFAARSSLVRTWELQHMDRQTEDYLARHFLAILDALSDGVYISDKSGKTLCVNRMYEQLTGLKREEIEGCDVRDMVRNGIFDSILNPEIVQTHKPATRVQHLKDGKTLVLSGYPVFNDRGELCFVVTFARDITILTNLNDQVEHQKGLLQKTEGQIAFMARQQKENSLTPSFASKAMGDGLAIEPAPGANTIVAPADGVVAATMPGSFHAIGLALDGGPEVLIHVGIDTVEMGGDGFACLVEQGQRVTAGQPLMTFSAEKIRAAGHPTITAFIVTDAGAAADLTLIDGVDATAGATAVATYRS